MKTLILMLTVAAAFCAQPAFAEEIATPTPGVESDTAVPPPAIETAQTPQTAPSTLCSKEDPYIEYRDCVNASTRDSNAKVRMA